VTNLDRRITALERRAEKERALSDPINKLQRIAAVLHQARVAGGWDDFEVSALVLGELGLTEESEPISREPAALDHE
jgi:hypothetical protein